MTLDLHIGAHKTATTFIQQTLRKNADALEAVGTRFLSPREFRYMHDENWNLGDMKAVHSLESNDPLSVEYALIADRKLLISDENLLGRGMPFYHANTLYPEIQKRLMMVGELFPCVPEHIYFTIRHYHDFYPAFYYQFSTRENLIEIGDVLQDRLLAKERRWPQVVDDVQAAFPNSIIKICLYEDISKNPLQFLDVLSGGAKLNVNLKSRPRQTGSASAYDAWITAMRDPNVDEKLSFRFAQWDNKSEFKAPKNDARFAERFWRIGDFEKLTTQYHHDVAELTARGLILDLEAK